MNYNIFFPIQIYSFSSRQDVFRIEPPSLTATTNHQFSFPSHFVDDLLISDQEKTNLRNKWAYERTVWGLNPKMAFYIPKGTAWVLIKQQNAFPYATSNVYIAQSLIPKEQTIGSEFVFGFYIFPIPESVLIYILVDNDSFTLKNLYFPEKEDDALDANFIPTMKNKNIPFYELFFYDKHVFMYVFPSEPSKQSWKAWNQICIPSQDGFPTYKECLDTTVDRMKNRNVYLNDPIEPMTSFFERRPVRYSERLIWILCTITLILLGLLIAQAVRL